VGDFDAFWDEARELNLIFASIVRATRKGMENSNAQRAKSA
jgi:hypothetical protein